MPEVIEVDFLRKEVEQLLIGKTVLKGILLKESLSNLNALQFSEILRGKKIIGARRKGKVLIIDFSNGVSLLIHFLLTGFARYYEKCVDINYQAVFYFVEGGCLLISGIMMGGFVKIAQTNRVFEEDGLKELGIDVLSSDFTLEKFKQIVRSSKRKSIKEVLIDQHIIAGIGNAYSDEILFEAKVLPFKKCKDLNSLEIENIFNAKDKVFKRAIAFGGESELSFVHLNGEKGEFHKHFNVHKREGEPCLICGTPIIMKKIGGRSSYYCPNCQK
jgi:formamidopyrimidine-DNA glycosylase